MIATETENLSKKHNESEIKSDEGSVIKVLFLTMHPLKNKPVLCIPIIFYKEVIWLGIALNRFSPMLA